MVLLVVDTQKLITNSGLYNFNTFENAVKSLIAAARENNVEVIYVRHDDGAGAELTKGTPGFKMIVPENANSTFENAFMTGEQSYKYYNEFMWKGRYAECISVEETIERMKG
jgi:nicotinamidase-related amidase